MNEIQSNPDHHEFKVETQEAKPEDLRVELLDGIITGHEFLEKIFQRDQSDGARSLAEDNVEILNYPDVSDFFHRPENIDDLFEYQNLLSLSYFHIGQKFAGLGIKDQALAGFESSLQAAEQIEVGDNDGYQEWIQYIRGTIAYMNNDSRELEVSLTGVKDDRNRKILESFLKGLESRGGPDYLADSKASLS